MNSLYQRKFNVDYFEKDPNRWRILSHLLDDAHDITVDIDFSVPDMIIKDTSIKFKKYPLEQCLAIEQKENQLKVIDIQKDFMAQNYREKVYKVFMGTEGCPNVMNLLGIAVPGFMYTYFPHLIKTGKLKPEEWANLLMTNFSDACLAHTLLTKNNK